MSTHDPSQSGPLPDSGHGSSQHGAGEGVLSISSRVHPLPAVVNEHATQVRPEILSAKPNPVELLHAVRRRWPLAVGLGTVVGLTAAAIVWYLVPVRYEAYALLKVSSNPQTVLIRSTGNTPEFTVFKRTQVQMILSSSVLQRTVSEPEINRLSIMHDHNDEPAAWLKNQLVIEYPDDSEILRVALKAPKSAEAKKIVDTVVDKYMKEVVQHERDLRNEHERKLELNYETYNANVKTQSDTLHKLQVLNKTDSTEAAQLRRKMEMERLGEFMSQRSRLNSQMMECMMQITLAEARRDNMEQVRPSESAIDMELSRDPTIAHLSQTLAMLNEGLIDMVAKTRRPESSNSIKKLRERIARTEDSIEERKANLKPKIMEIQLQSMTAAPSSQQLSLPLLEKQKEHLEDLQKTAEESVVEQSKVVSNLDDFNVNVQSKLEELHATQRITQDLRAELDRLKLERLAPERITKIDEAVLTSSGGDAVRKYVAVGFAGLLGFGLMLVGVAFVEFQARKINSVQEVHEGLGIHVLGELPNVSGRTWRRIKGGKGPALLKALMAERIDGARTNLMHTSRIASPHAVLVTSAGPHEGKTTTATQLAASLARSGRRTLLVDGDIRNPGAHRVFEMPLEPGLCELLRGEADREAVVRPTRTANLWLLPAGRCDLRSVATLSTNALGTIIRGLRSQYEYVVIDSGPVLKVADSLMVGQHVDAAIVSVLRDHSKVANVYECCERLRSVGVFVLGSVVNGVKDDVARHGIELLMAEVAAQPEAHTTSETSESSESAEL